MQIRLLSLFTIVDARGPEMDRSETVTMFNDLCVLAPATLIDPAITWAHIDDRRARGTFHNGGHIVSALLTFNDRAELTNFSSDDRAMTSNGKRYESYPWSTPLSDYREFEASRLASRGQAIWSMSDGDYCYGRLELVSVSYNE